VEEEEEEQEEDVDEDMKMEKEEAYHIRHAVHAVTYAGVQQQFHGAGAGAGAGEV